MGTVLLERMRAEGDFAGIQTTFHTTRPGRRFRPGRGFRIGPSGRCLRHRLAAPTRRDHHLPRRRLHQAVLPQLREQGWTGYWIDAAREKRLDEDSVIVLDPVNRSVIDAGIESGIRNFIGGNCTVSLMLLALGGLFEEDLDRVDDLHDLSSGIGRWSSIRCASWSVPDGGARRRAPKNTWRIQNSSIGLELDRQIKRHARRNDRLPESSRFGAPLAGQPAAVDRLPRMRGGRYPRGVEGLVRGEQDPRAIRSRRFRSIRSVYA